LLIAGIVIFSGCLDFLDEEDVNRPPQASANSEGGSNFEPNQEIVFTGKGSSDPDGDVLEYFWDFDKNDGKDESIIGNIANNGRITRPMEMSLVLQPLKLLSKKLRVRSGQSLLLTTKPIQK